jgi:hypothetical protein
LSSKDPVVLRGHAGTIFGATFLEAPFQPGTIVTGAYLDRSFHGEIKMWLPSRGTTAANAASHTDASAEALNVDAEKEIIKSGVLSLYQLHGTPQISCTTFEAGVHILKAEEQTVEEEDITALEDDEWRYSSVHRGSMQEEKRKRRVHAACSPEGSNHLNNNYNNDYQPSSSTMKRPHLFNNDDDDDNTRAPSYSFHSVLEVLGQQAPCTKTFVDKNSQILAIPSYDGAVRLYQLPEYISNPERNSEGSAKQNNAGTSACPTLEPSAVWMDNEEIEVREHGNVRME